MSRTNVSVQQLTRESEASREAFVHTVSELKEEVSETIDDLKTRISPSHLKAEIKEYVREESSELLASIERKARENPLQAVAIGAGLAYPLLGLLRSIPVPLLLIGGGIWLSGHGTGGIKEAVGKKAGDVAHSAEEALAARMEGVTEAVSDAVGDVKSSAEATVAAVKAKTAEAVDAVSDEADHLREEAAHVVQQSRTSFDQLIERNPLLVGGIAFALGAFVAASLPSTEMEDKLFGERSDEIKSKAAQAVADSVEQAKDAAADVVGEISAAAAREGLNSEAMSKTVEGATAAVKAVVDKGLTTALGSANGKSAADYH
jgi:ElaB/YqjD/DUF883 family membrane-anchored ribosome-binding protein